MIKHSSLLPENAASRTTIGAGDYYIGIVKAGQTLWGIARSYKVSLQSLLEMNDLSDASLLRVGSRLRIPGN